MALTTRARVLQHLGLADDSSSPGVIALAHTGQGVSTITVNATSWTDGTAIFLFADYPTLADTVTQINGVSQEAEAALVAGVDGTIASSLLTATTYTLGSATDVAVMTASGPNNATNAAFIDNLVTEVSAWIETKLNRKFAQTTYDERYDGGAQSVVVQNRPIDSAQALTVSYVDSSGTNTTLPSTGYRVDYAAGIIYALTGVDVDNEYDSGKPASVFSDVVFPHGDHAIRVQYTGGLATTPPEVTLAATLIVSDMYLLRRVPLSAAGTALGDANVSVMPAEQIAAKYEHLLAPHRTYAFGVG